MINANLQPRGTRRLIYVSDPSNTTSHLSVPAAQTRRTATDRSQLRLCWKYRHPRTGNLCRSNDHVLANRQMSLTTSGTSTSVWYPSWTAGIMPVEIYIDECHKQDMEFLAGFRMNDRHGHHTQFFKKLCDEKPEWVLREYKPSTRRAPPESPQIRVLLKLRHTRSACLSPRHHGRSRQPLRHRRHGI